MFEAGIAYELVGPDGTRAVFNNSADPDFIGYLDPDNGITGLMDTADVRESADDKVEGDGGVHGRFWLSRRTGTIQGIIWPDPDMRMVGARESKLKRASRGLRGDCVLSWTPSFGGARRQLKMRRQGRVTVTQRRPKTFQALFVCADPYAYSDTLQSLTLGVGAGRFLGGRSYPRAYARQYTTTRETVNVGGDSETWPTFTIYGPIVNPAIVNATTGQQIVLTATLFQGDVLVVDTKNRLVTLNNTNDYAAYAANFGGNSWFSLFPGINDIHLAGDSAWGAGTQLLIQWRDAWE